MSSATALAHPNIAFIKYWGNRDNALRLPANGSISMNLDGLFTRTTVTFSASFETDSLRIGNRPVTGPGLERVSLFLDLVRQIAGMNERAEVVSENNFPSGAGIASSAAAFAALALAASRAAGITLTQRELSRLARRGSGSACRSTPGGFVEWQAGIEEADSFATSIAPPEHWELVDCVAIVSAGHKKTGSTEGHALAPTSPLQAARVDDAPRRLDLCRRAILERDFECFCLHCRTGFRHDARRDDDLHPGVVLLAARFDHGHGRSTRMASERNSRLLHGGCRAEHPCHLSTGAGRGRRKTRARTARRAGCAGGRRRWSSADRLLSPSHFPVFDSGYNERAVWHV